MSKVEPVTDVHHSTILKLLTLAGERCERIMADKLRNVEVRDVECDEVWSFIGKKQKRVRPEDDRLATATAMYSSGSSGTPSWS